VDLVLASSSPRRAALLEAAGIRFRADAADVDETPLSGETPEACVVRLALAKARQAVRRNPGSLVLAADTTVVIDGRMLGKPMDPSDAANMLRLLAGRTHDVLTGVALACDDRERYDLARTAVQFVPLSADDVAWYVATDEPLGKAGAYAIQGLASRYVDRIEGSYSNVVGLPLSMVYRMLNDFGWAGG
jgi:septum formation protein